jgi:hypothetical protein
MPQTLPKLEEMRDILDIKGIKVWDLNWVGVLLLIVLAAVLFWWIMHFLKKKKLSMAEGALFKTPVEQALERLNDLVERGLIESGRVRQFYFSISEIFRDFLEAELHVPAAEATLEELKVLLKDISDFTQDEIKEAVWFLEICEMAKFAKYIPERDEIIRSVKTARVLMTTLARRREVLKEESSGVSVADNS